VRTVRILVVQHDWDKPLGRVGAGLEAARAELDVRMADDELPDPAGYDGLVVLPGLANPDDEDPAVHRARRSIEQALGAGAPVLGICLGGQLLAQALGGATYRCRDERGYHEVAATGAARRDPLLRDAPARFTTFHAHAYAFRPPSGADVLLENDVCVQACRLDEAWALQFHPEVGVEWVDALARGVRGAPDGVDPRTAAFFRASGVDPAELEAQARRAAPTAHRVAAGIAAGFAERCRAAAPVRRAPAPCEAGGR
jgi:GMP synthase-like glutamine amidotransferase